MTATLLAENIVARSHLPSVQGKKNVGYLTITAFGGIIFRTSHLLQIGFHKQRENIVCVERRSIKVNGKILPIIPNSNEYMTFGEGIQSLIEGL